MKKSYKLIFVSVICVLMLSLVLISLGAVKNVFLAITGNLGGNETNSTTEFESIYVNKSDESQTALSGDSVQNNGFDNLDNISTFDVSTSEMQTTQEENEKIETEKSATEQAIERHSDLTFNLTREWANEADFSGYLTASESYICAIYLLKNQNLYEEYGDFNLAYSHGTHEAHNSILGSEGTGWHHFVMDNGTHVTVYIEKEYFQPWTAKSYEIVENCHCCD